MLSVERYTYTLHVAIVDLHMAFNGSSELAQRDREEMLAWLKMRVDSWQPSYGPKYVAFDDAMKALAVAALKEWGVT